MRLLLTNTEPVGGYVMSTMRASLVVLSLSLVSGCGSESGFKESLELVVDEKVAIKLESSDPQKSLHKSNGELLSLIAASCELPHRIQEARRPSTDAAVAVTGSLASVTREHRQTLSGGTVSDGSSNKLGILSQKQTATMSKEGGREIKSNSTFSSAIPLTHLTADMLREQGVDFARVGDLNSHMALYEHLRSKYKLQSKAGISYRKVSISSTENGSEESVVTVFMSDEKLKCTEAIVKTSATR